MKKDLRFGFLENDVFRLKTKLESLLAHGFEERDSSFYGGRYFTFKTPALGQFILQDNFDSVEKEWIEKAHQDLPLLLNVSDTADSEKIKRFVSAIEGCRLILEKTR